MTINTRNIAIILAVQWFLGIGLLVLIGALRPDPKCVWHAYLAVAFVFATFMITQCCFRYFCANTNWIEFMRANPRYGTIWEQKGPIL